MHQKPMVSAEVSVPHADRCLISDRTGKTNLDSSEMISQRGKEMSKKFHVGIWSLLCLLTLGTTTVTTQAADKALNQPPEGFTALFNGENLDGWKGLVGNPKTRAEMTPAQLEEAQKAADEDMRAHWNVVDGVIVFDGKGKNLCTVKDYANFEMYVDWKIEDNGDSGIYLRGSPQIQIWDPKGNERNAVGSGGIFNNQKNPSAPTSCEDNPIGEWNTFYIKMVGENVTVKLNGKLVVDNVVMENYWERDKPIYPTGAIELQNHGNTLYFRNIYVKELP